MGGGLKTWKNQLQHAQEEKINFYVIEHPKRVDSHVILWDEEKKICHIIGSLWIFLAMDQFGN